WKGWAILLRQKQKKLIMLPSETMIWQPEFTDKTLSRKPGAVHIRIISVTTAAAIHPVIGSSENDVQLRTRHPETTAD
ncbi:hypothetical protein, partial [Escherichia coli]|uniref:hypothetical protein n=1 Tax=Escherichia coli TaxID=562 RepID=UPI001BDB9B6E